MLQPNARLQPPVCVSYLLLHNKLPQHLVVWKYQISFIISHGFLLAGNSEVAYLCGSGSETVVKLLSGAAVILSLDWAVESVFRLTRVVSGRLSSLLPVGQRFLLSKVIHNMIACSLLPSELGCWWGEQDGSDSLNIS